MSEPQLFRHSTRLLQLYLYTVEDICCHRHLVSNILLCLGLLSEAKQAYFACESFNAGKERPLRPTLLTLDGNQTLDIENQCPRPHC